MNTKILEKLVRNTITKFDFPDVKFDFVKITLRDNDPNIIYLTSEPRMNEVPGGYERHIQIYRKVYNKLMTIIQIMGEDKENWDVRNLYRTNENMEKEKFPFSQIEKDGKKIRTFKKDVDTEELVWHRDREDRLVEVLGGSNWELQLDNELPKKMKPGDTFIIPEGVYHRVKKGDEDLKIAITFLNENIKLK
jgi:hypothetical protein